MVNPTTVRQTKPSLNDMVYCANCGGAMVNTGKRYYCPNTSVDSGRDCTTKPVYADHLRRAVVSELINRLITDDNIRIVTETIQETTAANADLQRLRMEQAEAAIADAKAKRHALLRLVEHGEKTYQDVASEIDTLDQTTAGLAFESMIARNELEKTTFVSDEDGIRDTAISMNTWLGTKNPDETQELLDLLVRKVTVGSDSALIVYHVPMPTDEHPEGVTEDLVELYPSVNA